MEGNWVIETCCNCHVQFKITAEHQDHLKQSHKEFYCPSGHSLYYPGENKAEKLEKELEYKQNHIKRLYDENENNLEKITDLKKQLKDATEKKIQEPSKQDNKKVVKSKKYKKNPDIIDRRNGTAIHKSMIDYILETIPTVFDEKDVKLLIKKKKKSIALGSAKTYARNYCNHMLDNNMIARKGRTTFEILNNLPQDELSGPIDKNLDEIQEEKTADEKQSVGPAAEKVPAVKKAPNNTMLFLNWLDKWENDIFTMGDIVKETSLSKEKALKIVDHQIELGNLKKLSKWEFKKIIKSEDLDEQKGDVEDVKFDLQKPPVKLSCFEKWLNLKVAKKPFDIEQFYNAYPKQRQHKKHVEDGITELCAKGILIQLRGNLFRLPILKSEEEK